MHSPAKVAVVTGAARGIGLAIAQWFLAEGRSVALIDIDADTLAGAERHLVGSAGEGRVLALHCDVSDPAQVSAAVERVLARFGRIDSLVNNAGIAIFKPILDTTFEDWSQVMATNLDGPFICTQACAPAMLRTPRAAAW